ncbi:hypothetical protein VNO78_04008 [Psophocarpus tetragonolobus]|uniref:Uncharacterized protein n=1 Tax=Psophocarpus tetragonolobus TaxID=3891 RepID=A0AAN9XXH1_PSOTE
MGVEVLSRNVFGDIDIVGDRESRVSPKKQEKKSGENDEHEAGMIIKQDRNGQMHTAFTLPLMKPKHQQPR